MDVSKVRRIISEMKQKDFDFDEKGLEDSAEPKSVATDEQIAKAEKNMGIKYPETYKTFLKEYANGEIVLFGIEPMISQGLERSECYCNERNSARILNFKDIRTEKKTYIFPEKRYTTLGNLIAFTYYDGDQQSNSHWAFICDKEYPDNDYPVGYVSDNTENVICVLKNFETWLDVFWQGNRNGRGYYDNVLMLLYPDYEDRMNLIDNLISPEDYALYEKLRKKYDSTFRKYGID